MGNNSYSLDDSSSDNIDVDKDHIIESAVSNSSGDDNNGNTKENQTQQEQCQDGTEVTDLLACPSKLRPVRPPTCLKQVYLSIKS
ncbi:MAG: hypothetical protein WBL68_08100 [Nitrososphaeraceae archaeon]